MEEEEVGVGRCMVEEVWGGGGGGRCGVEEVERRGVEVSVEG